MEMPTKTDRIPRERAAFVCDSAGSILSVRIRGEIDHHTAAGIRQGIDGVLFEKRPKKLILDLSAVSFMDSSGLGLIMGRFSVMKELGGEMTVWNPSRETRAILTLAGMERLVRIEYPRNGDDAPGGALVATAGAGQRAARSPLPTPPEKRTGSRSHGTAERRKKACPPSKAQPGKEKNA